MNRRLQRLSVRSQATALRRSLLGDTGVLKEKVGGVDEALSSYERALAVEPAYADAIHNAALLLMRKRRKRRFPASLKLLNQLIATTQSSAYEAKRLAHLCRLELKQEQERR
jgi:hypothetical protein